MLVDSNILTQVSSETETANCRVKTFFLIDFLLSKIEIGLILIPGFICSVLKVESEGIYREDCSEKGKAEN